MEGESLTLKEIVSLILIPNRYLLVQSQQQKYQNKVPIMLKVIVNPDHIPHPAAVSPSPTPNMQIADWVFRAKADIVKLSKYSKQ